MSLLKSAFNEWSSTKLAFCCRCGMLWDGRRIIEFVYKLKSSFVYEEKERRKHEMKAKQHFLELLFFPLPYPSQRSSKDEGLEADGAESISSQKERERETQKQILLVAVKSETDGEQLHCFFVTAAWYMLNVWASFEVEARV